MKIAFIVGIVIIIVAGAFLFFSMSENGEPINGAKNINSFEACAALGNPVMESYPRRCQADGQTFVEDIGNELDKANLIRISYPRPNTEISSPLSITGEARGTWFFE